ncbi:hypothetical protein Q8A67_018720 [Cirrhinus molitorella]|uniref:Orange domain-containing protein n=1 Tax=Cirrhinus molitorella TaxID=172907 RepID=A0AA88PGU7_9TELE|nr:hypothetical protein Q8A67_018720 [Cirrhinus molitorella]
MTKTELYNIFCSIQSTTSLEKSTPPPKAAGNQATPRGTPYARPEQTSSPTRKGLRSSSRSSRPSASLGRAPDAAAVSPSLPTPPLNSSPPRLSAQPRRPSRPTHSFSLILIFSPRHGPWPHRRTLARVHSAEGLRSTQYSDRNPILEAEAQQKYSTGYIQCMQEVHNLLLSCDWIDKTLGSRLLNHLLKFLPRTAKDCPQLPKYSLKSISSNHSDCIGFHAYELESPKTCPPSPVLYERAGKSQNQCSTPMRMAHDVENPHLSLLKMWRPW